MSTENIFYWYSDVVLPDIESIYTRSKDAAFYSRCWFSDKEIIFLNWSCVFNCCSECPSVLVPDAEMNDEDDADITFIWFHHYKNISSCSLHEHIFSEHVKTRPPCMNIENVEKGKVTT